MNATVSATSLCQVPAFQSLSPMSLERLVDCVRLETVTKRAPLAITYPPSTHYLLPLTDNLTLHRAQEQGLTLKKRPEFGMRLPLGVLWPVVLKPHVTMWVRCLDQGSVGVLSADNVDSLVLNLPDVRVAILQAILQSNSHVNHALEQLACNDLTGRVAQLLLELRDIHGCDCIKMSHAQLATLLNVQRETVSVVIGRFRRSGWLTTSYGKITLVDCSALSRVAEQY